MYPFAIVILDNKEYVITTVGLDALVVGNDGVCVSPVSSILSVENSLVVDCCLMRGDVFGVGFFIFCKQVVTLFNDEFLR